MAQYGVFVCARERAHRVKHDLAEEHVLEGADRALILLRAEALERFDKVRIGSLVVLFLRVVHTRQQIQLGLKQWRAVDRVGV